MKIRQVFSTPDLSSARDAIGAARSVDVADADIALVARSDIEMESIPVDRLDASTDIVPAALRGAGTGGAIGIVAGLVAVAVPPIGITVAGAGLLALIGAAVGGWSAALAGSSTPNPVRRAFESEIQAGRILVVVDVDGERSGMLTSAMQSAGATQMPFEEASVLQ